MTKKQMTDIQRRTWLRTTAGAGAGLSTFAALGTMLQACGGSAHASTLEHDDNGFPAFFAQAPVLRIQDPLAAFLGAVTDGIMEYRYVDAVRLAGHSCPTVAGAYLMTLKGITALYGASLAQRGDIEVFMRDGADEGVTGVIAAVATLLTGAASATGFAGMGPAGRFSRKNLLQFSTPMSGVMALRRRDNGEAVQLAINHELTPGSEEMAELMPKAVAGKATPEELQRFAALWQERVKRMVVDHAGDERQVKVSAWAPN